MQEQALNGLKIVGFVTGVVGPFILKSLALHGATAIIVESEKREYKKNIGHDEKGEIGPFLEQQSRKYRPVLRFQNPIGR